jgi:SWI/SNF-related matrix-associated actin-dependent regulator 1 of chromatin subfamily A
MQLYTELGIAKAPAVCKYMNDILVKNDDKFIVFAHHIEVLDTIEKFLEQQVT